jgi:hypothetical protein
MKKILRNLIEEDIEKILDNKKVSKKNFFILILHFLLENNTINLKEVNDLSEELNKDYKEFLNHFEEELLESNGEIISVLRTAIKKFRSRMSPILEKIEKIKENDHSKNNLN